LISKEKSSPAYEANTTIEVMNITQNDLKRVLKCETLFVIGEDEVSFVDLYHTKEDRDIAKSFLDRAVDTWNAAEMAFQATQPPLKAALSAIGIHDMPDSEEFNKSLKKTIEMAPKAQADAIYAAAEKEYDADKHRSLAEQRIMIAIQSYQFWCNMVKKVETELKKAELQESPSIN
jgi:hypothetical protein